MLTFVIDVWTGTAHVVFSPAVGFFRGLNAQVFSLSCPEQKGHPNITVSLGLFSGLL